MPGKEDPQNSMVFWDKNRIPNPNQKTRTSYSELEETNMSVDFNILGHHIKENEK